MMLVYRPQDFIEKVLSKVRSYSLSTLNCHVFYPQICFNKLVLGFTRDITLQPPA